MKMTVVGIFDRKAQTFISMEPTANTAVAVRTLQEIVNKNDGNNIAKWPDDFELYELGTWDSDTGQLAPRSTEHDFNKGERNWNGDLDAYEKKLIISAGSLKASS